MKETHSGANRRVASKTEPLPTTGTTPEDVTPAATTALYNSEGRNKREGRLSDGDVGILGLVDHRLDFWMR